MFTYCTPFSSMKGHFPFIALYSVELRYELWMWMWMWKSVEGSGLAIIVTYYQGRFLELGLLGEIHKSSTFKSTRWFKYDRD